MPACLEWRWLSLYLNEGKPPSLILPLVSLVQVHAHEHRLAVADHPQRNGTIATADR